MGAQNTHGAPGLPPVKLWPPGGIVLKYVGGTMSAANSPRSQSGASSVMHRSCTARQHLLSPRHRREHAVQLALAKARTYHWQRAPFNAYDDAHTTEHTEHRVPSRKFPRTQWCWCVSLLASSAWSTPSGSVPLRGRAACALPAGCPGVVAGAAAPLAGGAAGATGSSDSGLQLSGADVEHAWCASMPHSEQRTTASANPTQTFSHTLQNPALEGAADASHK